MVKTTGPAVGSKGQVGFAEESKWGYPISPPNQFVEFTSESVVSEFTNLVSAALRADRAVHKQRIGTEAAAGDINYELCPEGFGTLLKHALGRRLTKRKDIAFVMVYEGNATDIQIALDSTSLNVTGSSDTFTTWIGNGDTVQDIMDDINGRSNWSCYAPWGDGTDTSNGGYFARSISNKANASTTLGSQDYDSTALAKSADGSTFNLETFSPAYCAGNAGSGKAYVFFPVYFKYGIYEHTIDAHSSLPQGLTFEIGRDVAAFNYYGGKVNTLSMTFNPGEFITGTFNFMFKGASTCGDISSDAGNTGWDAPVFGVRYAGSESSPTLKIDTDGTNESFLFSHGGENYYGFSLERGTHSHDGYYWETSTIAGLLEFLEYETTLFSVTRKGGVNPFTASINLKKDITGTLTTASDRVYYIDHTLDSNANSKPLIRGNYIGADSGESKTVTVVIDTGGATDGTAKFKSQIAGDSGYSDTQAITYNIWYDILDENNVDTGFDIMWPENVTLTASDTWTFTTFKDENASASYETEDLLTGFQGSISFDKGDGSGSVPQGVMGATFTLNNNLYGDKYELGERQRAALVPQRRATEGTLTLEFDDLDIYRMFVNGTAGDLLISVTSDEYINNSSTKYSITFRFPEVKFSGTTPTIGGEEIISTDFPFTALYDDTLSIPDLRITLTNSQSYI